MTIWQKKKHGVVTIPAFVVHIEDSSGEGGLSRSFRNGGIIKITQFGISLALWIPHILTQHHIWHGHWSDALQHLHLQEGTRENRDPPFSHLETWKTITCPSICCSAGVGVESVGSLGDNSVPFHPWRHQSWWMLVSPWQPGRASGASGSAWHRWSWQREQVVTQKRERRMWWLWA